MAGRRIALLAALALLTPAASAEGAFPGANGKIAYLDTAAGGDQISVVNPDGSGATGLGVFGHSPSWSPTGVWIAFTSYQGMLKVLFDGSRQTIIRPDDNNDVGDPVWSPDGTQIAYAHEDGLIHILNADGTGDRTLVQGFDPSWSPDGQRIALSRAYPPEIWTVDVDGTGLTDTGVRGQDVDWSPDGQKLAFTAGVTGGIHTMDSDGTDEVTLTSVTADRGPAWSPDGSSIAFARNSGSDFDLYTMRVEGTDVTPIAAGPGDQDTPTWQPVPPQTETGYARPKGATPLRVSLVRAYPPCTSPNRTHGGPLAVGSCNPPVAASYYLTVGTGDAWPGTFAKFVGAVRFDVKTSPPADVKMTLSTTDVRCRYADAVAGFCGTANADNANVPDYSGGVRVSVVIQATDKDNTSVPAGGTPGSGTNEPFPFGFNATCSLTTDTTIGSDCSIATTANAVLPGIVQGGNRAIWQLGRVDLYDGGPDGNPDTAPDDFDTRNTVFATQGVFVP
jgi:WD40-like Beta Propeller Repeat